MAGFTEKSVVRRPPCYLPLGQLIVDEMDISLQVQHKDKQRVTYKKVGDLF